MFSSVRRQGSRFGAWKAMPAILIGPATFCRPPHRPGLGNCSPVTSFIKVDLPQPDGPTTAANSPSAMDRRELFDGDVAAVAAVGVGNVVDRDEAASPSPRLRGEGRGAEGGVRGSKKRQHMRLPLTLTLSPLKSGERE